MGRIIASIHVMLWLIPFLVVSMAHSQEPPGVVWEFTSSENSLGSAYHVIQLDDESFVLAGEYYSYMYCLIHITQDGQPDWIWNGDIAGISSVRWVEEFCGSLITTGSWNNVFGRRLMLARVSLTGSTYWRKTYNNLGRSWGMCLAVLPDSSIVVGGRSYSESSYIPLLIRTNSEGNMISSKTFEEYKGTITRVLYHDGLVYAFINTVNEAPVLLAVNQYTLTKEWAVDYSGQLPEDEGSLCAPNAQSGILMVAGGIQARLNNTGGITWQSEPPGSDNRTLLSASATYDGGYILSGIVNMSLTPSCDYHPYNGWLVRTDGFGNTLWWLADSSGTESTFYYSAEQIEGGGYIVGGSRFCPNNMRELLLIRYEPETSIEYSQSQEQLILTASPNPFTQGINITYCIPEYTEVSLSVFDLSGRKIHSLLTEPIMSGEHTIMWSPTSSTPDGCYLITLDACGERVVRRAVFLR